MPLHTQREEDIGYFQKHFIQDSAENGVSYEEIRIMKFISNIYIKIAEREVERLKGLKKSSKYGYYHEDRIAANWDKVTVKEYNQAVQDQINYWQEELNKLK